MCRKNIFLIHTIIFVVVGGETTWDSMDHLLRCTFTPAHYDVLMYVIQFLKNNIMETNDESGQNVF